MDFFREQEERPTLQSVTEEGVELRAQPRAALADHQGDLAAGAQARLAVEDEAVEDLGPELGRSR